MRASRAGMAIVPLAAAAAVGQGTMTFFWTTDDTGDRDGVIEPGEAAVLLLWAGMEPQPPVGFAGSIFDIAGDAEYWQLGELESYDNLVGEIWGRGFLDGENNISAIETFQLPPFFNPNYDGSSPIALYYIRWRPAAYVPGWVGFWSKNHRNADLYLDQYGTSESYDIVVQPGSVRIVPAPAAGLLLGLGCVAWGRRR